MSIGYMVTISLGREYQPYRGWDQVFSKREDAEALCKQANSKFPGAKVVATTRGDCAVIEADGFFGDLATVVEVHDNVAAATKSISHQHRWQLIRVHGAEVGQKIHRRDIGTVYPRI